MVRNSGGRAADHPDRKVPEAPAAHCIAAEAVGRPVVKAADPIARTLLSAQRLRRAKLLIVALQWRSSTALELELLGGSLGTTKGFQRPRAAKNRARSIDLRALLHTAHQTTNPPRRPSQPKPGVRVARRLRYRAINRSTTARVAWKCCKTRLQSAMSQLSFLLRQHPRSRFCAEI